MRHPLALVLFTAAFAGCSGGGDDGTVLWLALDGTETQVKLVTSEPTPF